MLRDDAAEAAVRCEVFGAEEEWLLFAERVSDLGDGAERTVLGVEAEVERDGVEDVAENAAVGEEQDAGVGGEREALGGDPRKEVRFGGDGGNCKLQIGGDARREMVAVVEAIKVGAVVADEAERERVEFVEVEAEEEDAVAEAVLLGSEAVVHHGAVVEAGAEFRRRNLQVALRCVVTGARAEASDYGVVRAHSQILSPLTARLQSSAEANASSWKPFLK